MNLHFDAGESEKVVDEIIAACGGDELFLAGAIAWVVRNHLTADSSNKVLELCIAYGQAVEIGYRLHRKQEDATRVQP